MNGPLTKRELFAAAALIGLISWSETEQFRERYMRELVDDAFSFADYMLENCDSELP